MSRCACSMNLVSRGDAAGARGAGRDVVLPGSRRQEDSSLLLALEPSPVLSLSVLRLPGGAGGTQAGLRRRRPPNRRQPDATPACLVCCSHRNSAFYSVIWAME